MRPSDAVRTPQKDYQRAWRRENPAKDRARYYSYCDWINEIKRNRGCMDCGFNGHPHALDYDHRPGERKKFPLARGHEYARRTVEAEMAKCDLVCANCHRIRTATRMGSRRTL